MLGGRLRVAKAGRPLRGADHVSVGLDNLKEVELRVLSQARGFGEIGGSVAGLGQLEGHRAEPLCGGHALHG